MVPLIKISPAREQTIAKNLARVIFSLKNYYFTKIT